MSLPQARQNEAAHAPVHVAPKPNSDAPLYRQKWIWGIGAGVVWFFIFSAGMLLESLPHRVALGWSQEETRDDADIGRLTRQLVQLSNPPSLPNTTEAPAGQQVSSPPPAASTVALLTKAIEEQGSKGSGSSTNQAAPNQGGQGAAASTGGFANTLYHFLASMMLYTPLNVALLALLAGLIGGCASNEADHSELLRDIADKETEGDAAALRVLRRKLTYLEEHPAYSMMRSFIVYLVFISGLYIASSDPFNPSSHTQGSTQYIRLAGLVSVLGFIVGYDPTRFQHWLDLVPSPANQKQSVEEEGRVAILKTHTVQNTELTVPAEASETDGKGTGK